MPDARETAVSALFLIDKGQWNDNKLSEMIENAGLDKRDSAFCTALCEGTLQNRMLIDYQISACSTQKLNKISPYVLNVLRCAVYQFEFMERVPVSAAVNTAVNLARKSTNPRAAGYVNAILRKLSGCYKDIAIPNDTKVRYLSIKYSHPEWLVRELMDLTGEADIEKLLIANNSLAKICIRVNTIKSTTDMVRKSLLESGVEVTRHEFLPSALLISKTGNITGLQAFKDGLFTVQDAASQLCAQALDVKTGESVLDLCAAPGGKSFAIAAQTNNHCNIICCDINNKRLRPLIEDAERLGVSCITAQKSDATVYCDEFESKFECVLADVPCSGTGDLRRKPEIRYKDEASIDRLPEIQGKILTNAAKYVKPGGTLMYSTCSLLRRENLRVVEDFLQANDNYQLTPFKISSFDADKGYLTLLPHIHGTDGFFMAKLHKRI